MRRIIQRVKHYRGERLSEPVDIDNTPPVVARGFGTISRRCEYHGVFDADDATGKIKTGDFSMDGGPGRLCSRRMALPTAGTSDIRWRCLLLPREHTVSLRAFDSSGNVGTLSVTCGVSRESVPKTQESFARYGADTVRYGAVMVDLM